MVPLDKFPLFNSLYLMIGMLCPQLIESKRHKSKYKYSVSALYRPSSRPPTYSSLSYAIQSTHEGVHQLVSNALSILWSQIIALKITLTVAYFETTRLWPEQVYRFICPRPHDKMDVERTN